MRRCVFARRRRWHETALPGTGPGVSAPLSSRERILAATVQVALRDGVSAMTLDAVAREAGVSKGGLLYHFASKDELIAAMLEHHAARIQKTVEARMAADPNPQRAVVPRSGANDPRLRGGRPGDAGDAPVHDRDARRVGDQSAACSTRFASGLKAVREQLLEEGPNGMRQVALWPAVFGLMLWRHLGVLADDDPVRQSIVEELLGLAEGPDPSVSQE